LLDPIALAQLIKEEVYNPGGGIRATHSFSIKDTVLLVNVFILKFKSLRGFNCNITKLKNSDQFVIYIRTDYMENLRSLVIPYMQTPTRMYHPKIAKILGS